MPEVKRDCLVDYRGYAAIVVAVYGKGLPPDVQQIEMYIPVVGYRTARRTDVVHKDACQCFKKGEESLESIRAREGELQRPKGRHRKVGK